MVVGRTRIDLRFLRTFRESRDGSREAKVRVYCHGCRRFKTIPRLGLRVSDEPSGPVVDVQSNCHECRAILNRGGR